MTKKEAIAVVKIMLKADGGCSVCVRSLLADFVETMGFKNEVLKLAKAESPTLPDDVLYALGDQMMRSRRLENREKVVDK